MVFDPNEPEVERIVEELGAAAERGVKVGLAIDAFIFLNRKNFGPGPLFFKKDLPERLPPFFRHKLKVMEALRARGVTCSIINRPGKAFTNPLGGRSHIKLALVNDRFYIGGCNLDTAAHIDLMVSCTDSKTADWLYDFALKMLHNKNLAFMQNRDWTHQIDGQTTLFIDSGQRNQSLIFRKALEIIDCAQEEILMACQFFPNSTTAQHLAAAHQRGVKVTILYNPSRKHSPPFNVVHYLANTYERTRMPAALFTNHLAKHLPYIHAKLIASEQAAIVGSHNFVPSGVKLGTAEIALLSLDTGFVKQVKTTLEDLCQL